MADIMHNHVITPTCHVHVWEIKYMYNVYIGWTGSASVCYHGNRVQQALE